VSPNFVVSFELWNGKESAGSWQLAVQARVWREIPVAHSPLNRGQLLRDADVTLERRDVLVHRDAFMGFPTEDATLELAEHIAEGLPMLNRSVRPRPVIRAAGWWRRFTRRQPEHFAQGGDFGGWSAGADRSWCAIRKPGGNSMARCKMNKLSHHSLTPPGWPSWSSRATHQPGRRFALEDDSFAPD